MKVGIDIEKISKFSKLKFEKHKRFYEKIFTEAEIKYCLSKSDPYQHFTSRYCVKEAVTKTLDNEHFEYKDIEVKMNGDKPILSLPTESNRVISMSHTDDYAIAVVFYYDIII